MANMNQNAMPMEASTTLMVCILIDEKEILPQALQNEKVMGVLMGWMNVEPRSFQDLNETTFLATYAVDILAEEIGTVIEKIDNWLGMPVVITCNEVTTVQLPYALDLA